MNNRDMIIEEFICLLIVINFSVIFLNVDIVVVCDIENNILVCNKKKIGCDKVGELREWNGVENYNNFLLSICLSEIVF